MRDTVHPTNTLDASGIVAYTTEIIRARNAPRLGIAFGNTPFVRIGAESMTGGWAFVRLAQTPTSPANDIGALVSAFGNASVIRAMQSSSAGTLTLVTPACEHIGLLHLVHQTAGGEVDVSVDGGSAIRINTTEASSINNYGRGTFIAGGLARTTHTVTITWVSGTPAIVGVSGC